MIQTRISIPIIYNSSSLKKASRKPFWLLQKLFFSLLLLLAIFFLNSCQDNGCIEADDFGDYESQDIYVYSNNRELNCDYDLSNLDNVTNPNFKLCLTTGTKIIIDSNNKSHTGTANLGCNGFVGGENTAIKKICADNCKISCMGQDTLNSPANRAIMATASSATSPSTSITTISAEPNWVANDSREDGRNQGVTIYPQTEIKVRALGNISLSKALDSNTKTIAVSSKEEYGNSYANTNPLQNTNPIDLLRGQGTQFNFYGNWTDEYDNGNNIAETFNSDQPSSGANDAKINEARTKNLNLAKRLVVYSIPHPKGYTIDPNLTSEITGTSKVPLEADPETWRCDHSEKNEKKTSCESSDYSLYVNADNAMSNAAFPITTASRKISNYGGFIRFNGDNFLAEDEENIFEISGKKVSCTTTTVCDNQDKITAKKGTIIDLSSDAKTITVPKNTTVYLKNLNSDCLNDLTVNATGETPFAKGPAATSYKVLNSSWTKITMFNNEYSLSFAKISDTCANHIGVRFISNNTITMPASGFISFKNVNSLISGSGNRNCSLSARIYNQTGLPEYEDLTDDPLKSVIVGDSFTANKIYVRKGQIISFEPESWNGTWSTDAGNQKKCGIGMAMKIKYRPALLCTHKADDYIRNPDCSPNIEGSKIKGCSDYEERCFDNSSSYYCPNSQECFMPLSCSGGDDNSASSCTTKSGEITTFLSGKNQCSDDQKGNIYTKCQSCNQARLVARTKSPKIPVSDIWQCYDLEDYTGNVADLKSASANYSPTSTTGIDNLLRFSGLRKLQSFTSDYYGSFKDYTIENIPAVPATSTTPAILQSYKLKSKDLFRSSYDARLRFLVLDGSDFKDIDTSYSSNSGRVTIETVNDHSYSNGKNLEIILCQEDKPSDEYLCRTVNGPNDIKTKPGNHGMQPKTVSITSGSNDRKIENVAKKISTTDTKTAPYEFNQDGNLTRISPINLAKDCSAQKVGDEYYCHSYYQIRTQDQTDPDTYGEKQTKKSEVKKLRLAFKIKDDVDGDYSNNTGSYFVNVKSKIPPSESVSKISGSIINTILEAIDGKETVVINGKPYFVVEGKNIEISCPEYPNSPLDCEEYKKSQGLAKNIYIALINDSFFKYLLQIVVVLSITFYGLGYLIGTNDMKQATIVKIIFKIGFIYLFVDPNTGWKLFQNIFVDLFKDGTNYLAYSMASAFDDSPRIAEAISNNNFSNKADLFSGVDEVLSLFFNSTVQKKILALFFSSIFGWLYMVIIYYSILIYLYAVANSILLYLTAQFFISIIFILGPLFFLFLLFEVTKEMFDNWLKALIGFSLQQIFLLTTLSFFNMLMYDVIKSSLGYKICWDNAIIVNNALQQRTSLLSFWVVEGTHDASSQQSDFIQTPQSNIPSLYRILYMLTIATLMKKFITMMTDLASSLSSGIKASALGKNVAKKFNKMESLFTQGIKGTYNRTLGIVVNKLDEKLFDSGKIASQQREARKIQNAEDNKKISEFQKAGSEAVNKFKKENASQLVGKSESEKAEMLRNVRNEGIKQYASDKNINETEVSRLMNKKGVNYDGVNVFSFALKTSVEAYKGRLLNSLDDKKVSTTFSQKEAREALKNMKSTNERDKFFAATNSEIKVNQGTLAKSFSAIRNPTDTTKKQINRLGNYLGKKAKVATNLLHNPEKTEARKFLEESGKISKIGSGKGVFRSEEEKDLIKKQMEKNEQEKRDKEFKKSSNKAILELEKYREKLEKAESNKKDGEEIDSKKINQSIGLLKKEVFGFKREEKNNIASEKANRLQDKIKKEIDENEARLSSFKKQQEAIATTQQNQGNDEAKNQTLAQLKFENEKQIQNLEARKTHLQDYYSNIADAKDLLRDKSGDTKIEKEFRNLNNSKDFENFVIKYKKPSGVDVAGNYNSVENTTSSDIATQKSNKEDTKNS